MIKNILKYRLLIFILLISSCKTEKKFKQVKMILGQKATVPQNYEFGFILNDFNVSRGVVKKGETFSQILLDYNIGYGKIYKMIQIIQKSNRVFNVRKIKERTRYTVLLSKNNENAVEYFIYQPSLKDYVVFDFNKFKIYKRQKKIKLNCKTTIAKINNSLHETIKQNKLDSSFIYSLSNIYAWTIDFFKLQKGDYFKIVYDEAYVNDTTYIGIHKIRAAYFYHNRNHYYAFRFKTKKYLNFFDEKGYNLRKTFLRAPLKYTRISSRYSRSRFHPILRRWKSHKGTDYAAPRGTPIMATAKGIVSKAGYTRGNGNYVKIKHNIIYSTQYLHMSRIKKGIRIGVKVNQGDIIGYVGSTGYSSGPHVCYRFWKNGKQVDPYRQKLPNAEPLHKKYYPVFNYKVNKYKFILDGLEPNF